MEQEVQGLTHLVLKEQDSDGKIATEGPFNRGDIYDNFKQIIRNLP